MWTLWNEVKNAMNFQVTGVLEEMSHLDFCFDFISIHGPHTSAQQMSWDGDLEMQGEGNWQRLSGSVLLRLYVKSNFSKVFTFISELQLYKLPQE